MESVHRENILSNIDRLMKVTDYENFIECCLKKNILSQTMKENLEEEFGNETDRKLALWRKIPKRGPKAYAKLLEICSEDFPVAYTILNKSTGKNLGQMASVSQPREPFTPLDEPDIPDMNLGDGLCMSFCKEESPSTPELKPYSGPVVNHLNLTVKKSTRIHTNPKLKVYKMKSRNRGVLLLINIIKFKNAKLNRFGANYDRDNLIYLFTELGFTIYYEEDIKPEKMFQYIEIFQMRAILEKYDCFVFGIMTHGNIENHHPYVEFGNGEIISLDSILEKFYNITCYSLLLKPKIFILPFCRGSHPDQGVYVQNVQHDGHVTVQSEIGQSSVVKITTKSDILICYATVKGFESHRNMDKGSWYIQALCQVWAENAHDTDVETMMKMVDTKMREQWGQTETRTVQTASMENLGFNKALFLNPGFYEEE
uniref:Putative caspase nc n=1 Tax=Phlebotomus kandelakii TaxID=1109342 RepID=A0A6B2E8A4_9DIPT